MYRYTKKTVCTTGVVLLMAGAGAILHLGSGLYSGSISPHEIPGIFHHYTFLGRDGVILQEGKSDCGPAALMNVFQHYGIQSSLEEIEAVAGTTERGTSMLGLKQMARLNGLEAQGWKFSWEDFQDIAFPAIVFVRGNHYVVVESITHRGSVVVIDPARGRSEISEKGFRRIWGGETLQIEKAGSIEPAFLTEGYR